MSVTAPTIGLVAPLEREHHRHETALVAACAALDAVATGILLLSTPLSPSLAVLAAAVHVMAVLLIASSPREQPSRRWLSVAAVLALPCVGAAVAAAALVTRGRGSAAMGRHRMGRRRPALTMAAVRRLGDALSPCDALDRGDEEQRRAALATLSRRGDPEAIALLLRTAAGPDPDLALCAALALDEISERAERRTGRPDLAEVRYAGA